MQWKLVKSKRGLAGNIVAFQDILPDCRVWEEFEGYIVAAFFPGIKDKKSGQVLRSAV